ncbi:ABC transporter substrate-binding protein [Candidatus Halobeggiatoa sp. HSG11]|nr:ABC transporter substrate-binding protein [Candidatus Halobeggiatoa sp. HSG11]
MKLTIIKSLGTILTKFIIIMLMLAQQAYAADKIALRVGYLPILDHLTLLVSHAKDNDSFQHINVKPKLFKSWREMAGALRADVIDAAFILSPLAMDLFNQGVNVKAILLAHRNGSAITVKTGSDITKAQDFQGKIIAIPDRKSTHTALLDQYLRQGNLSLQDVKTKVIAPPNMLKVMQLGRIDAFIVAEPFGAKAQAKNIGKILVLTKDIVKNHVECVVVVNSTLIHAHATAIQEWVNSLIQVGKWIDTDKLENGSKQVANLTAKKYFPHNQQTVTMGLQNPVNRISFSDLNPSIDDFKTILDISLQANIIQDVKLNDFIEQRFYTNHLGNSQD